MLRGVGLHLFLFAAGRRLLAAERYLSAELYLQAASRLAPTRADIWLALASCLQCRHCPHAAIDILQKVLELAPDMAEARLRLAHSAAEAEMWPLAIERFEQLLAESPGSPQLHYHLAGSYAGDGQLEKAVQHFRAALAVEEVASTHNGLGLALSELAMQEESIAHFRRAAELSDKPAYLSNLLFTLCYDPALSPEALYQAHIKQAARFPQAQARKWRQSFDPERPLRIGYVSPDLRFHPVAFFIEPVMREHDASRYQIHAYSTQMHRHSETTLRLKASCADWREFDDAEDEALEAAILADRIDILIDLAGHTGNNSLPLLAKRLAPVQVSWLGYLNTTGLAAMDYRLTDATACPTAFAQPLHSEQLIHMPHSQWCYQAPADSPPVAPAPCLSQPGTTFGALHNPAKVGPAVIALWAGLLRAVPDARLLIAARGFSRIAAETRARFAALGVAEERIVIRDRQTFADYLSMHGEIDINLDVFPYTGGTTTCHSLWMGVPVLTLACPSVMGRGGASALHCLALDDWIAASEEDYIAIGRRMAAAPARLAALRQDLRERMAHSPLMQAEPFTRALEARLREMWRQRCLEASVRS
ncbi:O-linked N-acetylglucosamine transferase, SPINDLY family protein [Chitinimonas arctica]|uniref:O-linked N-acetylglucosamine transferase, SPINDLY family protein n=1 Tax=Chitinimonas arctica TaxID=2594795 RepID=UPI0015D34889|nr:tetratricopeptide repeat protein [Chitinimonas arctica]